MIDNNYAVAVINEVRKAVIGKDQCVYKVMAAILAGGHILIEDIPGVGKTTLAMAFSKSMDLEEHRVQFTPDVMPADITGFSMYNKQTSSFAYHEGAVMCNLFLADEINRTSPKTQSALLEVMEEGHVTVDGETHPVPSPFVVIATQNPVGSAGTQRLPMSQLDRFMICISMGYPSIEDEIEIVKGKTRKTVIEAIISKSQLTELKEQCDDIFVHDVIYKYIGMLIERTRQHPMLDLGLSPRGTIALTKISKAMAFLKGRNYVIPDDVTEVFHDAAAHRLVLSSKARINNISEHDIIAEILSEVKKPTLRKKS